MLIDLVGWIKTQYYLHLLLERAKLIAIGEIWLHYLGGIKERKTLIYDMCLHINPSSLVWICSKINKELVNCKKTYYTNLNNIAILDMGIVSQVYWGPTRPNKSSALEIPNLSHCTNLVYYWVEWAIFWDRPNDLEHCLPIGLCLGPNSRVLWCLYQQIAAKARLSTCFFCHNDPMVEDRTSDVMSSRPMICYSSTCKCRSPGWITF